MALYLFTLVPVLSASVCQTSLAAYARRGCCSSLPDSGVDAFVCSTTSDLYKTECCGRAEEDVRGHAILQDFPAFRWVGDRLQEQGKQHVSYSSSGTTLVLASNSETPSLYSLVKVTQQTLPFLAGKRNMNALLGNKEDMLRLDDDGNVISVKLLFNSVHLMVRKDILDQHQIPIPTTYSSLFSVLNTLRSHGYDTPYSFPSKEGWNGAYEVAMAYSSFTNGTFPTHVNVDALKSAIDVFRTMLSYSPLPMRAGSDEVQASLSSGESVIAHLWQSRAKAVLDSLGSERVSFHAPLRAREGGTPHTFLWWDGVSLASDNEDAVSSLLPFMESSFYETGKDLGAWFGYEGEDVPHFEGARIVRADPNLIEFESGAISLHNMLIPYSGKMGNATLDSSSLAEEIASAAPSGR